MRLPEGRKAKGRRYPQWLILSLMTLAKLCGYHAYAEMARFVRNHSYLLPLWDFHCAPDKRGGFTLGGAHAGPLARRPAEVRRGLLCLRKSGVMPLALGKRRLQLYKPGGAPGVDGRKDLRAHQPMSPMRLGGGETCIARRYREEEVVP